MTRSLPIPAPSVPAPPWNFNPPPHFGLRLTGDDAWDWVLSKPRRDLDAHVAALLAQLRRQRGISHV